MTMELGRSGLQNPMKDKPSEKLGRNGLHKRDEGQIERNIK
ncbi:hypothetical protein [Lysinibacillus endophyticus]|nr:hypothetical protein [Lysinibacillus endophyticus]